MEPSSTKKPGMSTFRKAMLWTGLPLVGLSLLVFGARIVIRTFPGAVAIGFSGMLAALLWVLVLFTGLGLLIAGRRQVGAGMLAGAGIGLVGMGLTCFGPLLPFG